MIKVKKMIASFLAVSSLAVCMASIPASAATSSWSLYQPQGNGVTYQCKTVTGLKSGSSTGILFETTYKSGTVTVECDIYNSLLRRDTTHKYLLYNGSYQTAFFSNNWYANNNYSGSVQYYVKAINYGLFSVNGTAC